MLSPASTTISVYQPIVEKVVEPNFLGLDRGDWVQIGVGFATLMIGGGIAARNWRIGHQLKMLDVYYNDYSKLLTEVSVKNARIIEDIESFVLDALEPDSDQYASKKLALRATKISRTVLDHYSSRIDAYLNAGTVNFFNIPFFYKMNEDLSGQLKAAEAEIYQLLSGLIDSDDDKRVVALERIKIWLEGRSNHELHGVLRDQLAFLVGVGNSYMALLGDYPYFASMFSSVRPNEFFLFWSERQSVGSDNDSILLKYHAYMHGHDRKILSLHRRFLVSVKRFMYKKFFT